MEKLAKLLSCGKPQYSEMDSDASNNVSKEQERIDDLNDLNATKLAICLSEGNNTLILPRHLNKYRRNRWTTDFQDEISGKEIISYLELPTAQRNDGNNQIVMQQWKVSGKKAGSATLVLKELDAKNHVVQRVIAKITVVQ
jgi:hypothetical protein